MTMLQGEHRTDSETEAAVLSGDGHAVALGHRGNELSTPGGEFRHPAGGLRQIGQWTFLAGLLLQADLEDCLVMLAVAVNRAGFGFGMTRCCAALASQVRREGSAGSVPGGTQVRVIRRWFGADRGVRVVVPGQFAVGADGSGFLLPGQARGGGVRDRTEGGDRPRKAAGGGVLADAASAVVHGGGKLGEEPAAFGVCGLWHLCGPGGGGEWGEVAVAVADAGVDRGGDVADAGQVPLATAWVRSSPASRPASSAARRVRCSHCSRWLSCGSTPAGSAERSRSR